MTDTGEARHVIEARLEKLAELREMGVEPYAYRFETTASASTAVEEFVENGDPEGQVVRLAGRVRSLRPHGKTTFAHLEDRTGQVQIYLRKDTLGEEGYDLVKLLDLGDWIGVEGEMFRTRTGEATVRADEIHLLSKTVRPLPLGKEETDEEGESITHGGFADKESRYRQRYADLAVHPEVRATFMLRAKVVRAIRNFLDERGFIEVETPILQPIYGGATAEPFTTFYRAIERQMYLRIADELYLKRLLVGGLERVYEIGKDFRNEGIDRLHNPEFTMLELYQAFADYNDMMELTEELLRHVLSDALGSTTVGFQGEELDFEPPLPRLTWLEALQEHGGIEPEDIEDEKLLETALEAGVEDAESKARAALLDGVFKARVEEKLVQPTIVHDYPVELSPLAKRKRDGNGQLTERFELFVAGTEIANAFSELNDPFEQRERFEDQVQMQEEGWSEAHQVDEDYIRALEYGLPPTGGMGLGLDRLLMIITDQPHIRQVILFPMLRPE